MKPAFLLTIFLSIGVAVLAEVCFAADSLSLVYEDLPALVQKKNKNSLSGVGFLNAAEARTRHLNRSFLPTIKTEMGYESFKTGNHESDEQPYGEIEARVNLYRGHRDVYEDQVRHAEVDAASATATQTYRQELLRARQAFWTLVHAQEMADFLKKSVEQNRVYIEGAQRRARRGLTTETDRLGFEMMEIALREDIESQNHEVILIEAELASLIGVPLGTGIQTLREVVHLHRPSLMEGSVSSITAPGVRQVRSHLYKVEAQKKASLSLWRPAVDLYGGYYLSTLRERDDVDRKDRDDIAIGLNASLFLFDARQSKSQAESLSFKADALSHYLDYLSDQLQSDNFILKEELRHLDDLVHSSEKQIELGKKYLEKMLDEYDRGVKNAPDVLGAFEKSVHLQRQYLDRRRDYKLAETRLMNILGE